jgi:hypothetical protein
MEMKRVFPSDVQRKTIGDLSLNFEVFEIGSTEVIASSLRRAASIFCPCSAATLIRNVLQPLRGVISDAAAHKLAAEQVLDELVAYGDLIEQRELSESSAARGSVLLYAAPPAMVLRDSGVALLVGVPPGRAALLPPELERRVENAGHVRKLIPYPGEDLRGELARLGLLDLSNYWIKTPRVESAAHAVDSADRLLSEASPSLDIPGLILLDPESRVSYYRGRWVEPKAQSGRFVARRSQAYGADLWCYVELAEGRPLRMIDFPAIGSRWRGCDDAWRLQLAIDARRGHPQRYRVGEGVAGASVLEVFSPVPAWAQRRWDAVGEEVKKAGCLFAYRFPSDEISQEVQFARDALWLTAFDSNGP